MIRYSLDTNAVIAVLSARSALVTERVYGASHQSIGISSIVTFELIYGAHKGILVHRNLEQIRTFLALFPSIDFNAIDAAESGQIRAYLKKAGKEIGPFDTLIAGQARARGLIVVTNNVGEFSRVEGLTIEDWSV